MVWFILSFSCHNPLPKIFPSKEIIRHSIINTYRTLSDLSYFYATTPGQTRNYLTHARGKKEEDVPGTCLSGVTTIIGSQLCVKYDYTETTCISGYKLNEKNQGLFGWTIYIDDNGNSQLDLGEVNTTTNETGYWQICGLLPGSYTVCEVLQTGWTKLDPPGCHDITIDDPPLPISNINFTNIKLACLSGYKLDGCPPYSGLSGWTIWANDTLGNNTSTVTNGAGYWEICNLRNETYTVCEVLKDGWAQTSLPICYTEILAGTNITNINFINQRLLNISGYKLDNCTKLALSGWMINLTNGSFSTSKVTDDTGKYEFLNLSPDTYTLSEVPKDGWSLFSAPSPVTLSCSDATYQNFTNQELLNISGYKLDNCTKLGLSGWTINLTNGTYKLSMVTDGTGRYEFTGLWPGTYTLSEVSKAGWSLFSAPSPVTLTCSNASNQNFSNQQLLSISGYKLDNCTKLGLSGWTINLTNGTYKLSEVTDGAGRYEFTGLSPGTYTLSEVSKAGWSLFSAPSPVTLTCSNASNQNFTNQVIMSISGYKLDNCTKLGLSGWTINLTNGTYKLSEVTDGTGKYQFTGLSPGIYTLSEVPQDGWSLFSAPSPVTLTCSNASNQNFTNQKLLNIDGYKLDSCTKLGLSGWTINLTNGTYKLSMVTDGTGKYQFTGLWPGTYTLSEVPKDGWSLFSAPSPVTLTCSNASNQNFTNQKLWCISGQELNSCTLDPLDGWTIEVFNKSTGQKVGENTSNTTGHWQICGLAPGEYLVNETVKSGWHNEHSSQSVSLVCENKSTMNFNNDPQMCLGGYKLNSSDGSGLSGWTIEVFNKSTGNKVGENTTNATGFWQVCNLDPGIYRVTEKSQPKWIPLPPHYYEKELACCNFTDLNFTNLLVNPIFRTLGFGFSIFAAIDFCY